MDVPVTSTQSAAAAARRRSTRATASGSVLDIAGVAVGVDLTGAAADALRELLADARPAAGPAAGTLRWEPAVARLPARDPDVDFGELHLWHEDDRVLARHDTGVTAVLDPSGATLGGPADDPAWVLRRLLPQLASHLVGLGGRHVLHAAAVVDGGRAVLVLGPTGAGKSTVALAALEHGLEVVADDLVALDGAEPVAATGVPRPPWVPGDASSGGRALAAAGVVPGDVRARRRLAAGHLRRAPAAVAAVAVLVHAHGAGGLSPVDPAHVLELIVGSAPGAHRPEALRALFPVAARLSRLPARMLGLAADPSTRLADAARDLRALARA